MDQKDVIAAQAEDKGTTPNSSPSRQASNTNFMRSLKSWLTRTARCRRSRLFHSISKLGQPFRHRPTNITLSAPKEMRPAT